MNHDIIFQNIQSLNRRGSEKMLDYNEDELYMLEAIHEAKKAEKLTEVPIGAVIVSNGEIIARAHNLRETKQNAVSHAELLAIEQACEELRFLASRECNSLCNVRAVRNVFWSYSIIPN